MQHPDVVAEVVAKRRYALSRCRWARAAWVAGRTDLARALDSVAWDAADTIDEAWRNLDDLQERRIAANARRAAYRALDRNVRTFNR